MIFSKALTNNINSRSFALASIFVATVGLAGCAGGATNTATPAPSVESTQETSAASLSPTTIPSPDEPQATESTTAAIDDPKVTVEITGSKPSALVKALVVTDEEQDNDGQMRQESLPYNIEMDLPAGGDFTKILVLGKYANGAAGEISCTVSINDERVAEDTSNGRQPAKCIVLQQEIAR